MWAVYRNDATSPDDLVGVIDDQWVATAAEPGSLPSDIGKPLFVESWETTESGDVITSTVAVKPDDDDYLAAVVDNLELNGMYLVEIEVPADIATAVTVTTPKG